MCRKQRYFGAQTAAFRTLSFSRPPTPHTLAAAFAPGTADPAGGGGQIENDREPQSTYFNRLIIEEVEFSQIYMDIIFYEYLPVPFHIGIRILYVGKG